MSWSERSCVKKGGNCGQIITMQTCNVDCKGYEWDQVTKPDSMSSKEIKDIVDNSVPTKEKLVEAIKKEEGTTTKEPMPTKEDLKKANEKLKEIVDKKAQEKKNQMKIRLPVDWKPYGENKKGMFFNNKRMGLYVFMEVVDFGKDRWAHLVVSKKVKKPSLQELYVARNVFVGNNKEALILLPSKETIKNEMHIWHCYTNALFGKVDEGNTGKKDSGD